MNKRNLVQHLILALLPAIIVLLTAGPAASEAGHLNVHDWRPAQQQQQQQQQPKQRQQQQQPPLDYHQLNDNNPYEQHQPPPQEPKAARLFAVSESTGKRVALMPGLLDESLMDRGSFSFGAKQVAFPRLKVLGNVYVKNVNGRPLHESYLFRSRLLANGYGGGGGNGAAGKKHK